MAVGRRTQRCRCARRRLGMAHGAARGVSCDEWRFRWLGSWSGPSDVKQRFSTASFIAGDRIVFNIKGNSYRLIVAVKYAAGIVFIRFVGTHAQYDRINAAEV